MTAKRSRKARPRTFTYRVGQLGYYVSTFVLEAWDEPSPVHASVGDVCGANDLLTMVANGNAVLILPHKDTSIVLARERGVSAKGRSRRGK